MRIATSLPPYKKEEGVVGALLTPNSVALFSLLSLFGSRNQHIGQWTLMHTYYPYEYLQKTEPEDFEIDEVTTCISLLTNMSPTIERISQSNHEIYLENVCTYVKYRTSTRCAGSTTRNTTSYATLATFLHLHHSKD